MSSLHGRRSPENAFLSSKLTIIPSKTTGDSQPKSSSMTKLSEHRYSTKSYLRDSSSGRASVKFQALLRTNDSFDRNSLLKCGAIKPAPPKLDLDTSSNVENNNSKITADYLWSSELETLGEAMDDDYSEQKAPKRELQFQCTCKEVGINPGKIVIEAVSINSTALVGNDLDDEVGISFDIEISLRDTEIFTKSSIEKGSEIGLEIRALFLCTDSHSRGGDGRRWTPTKTDEKFTEILLGMKALDMGMNNIIQESSPYFCEASKLILPPSSSMPLYLDILLAPALTIDVAEIVGASSHRGVTLVSVILSHSNYHDEIVTVTNIALYPGHSRLLKDGIKQNDPNSKTENIHGKTMPGGEDSVINMSRFVRWGYASGTAPTLPLVLKPHEAVATVIEIHGRENMSQRYFESPVCAKAIVGDDYGRYHVDGKSKNFCDEKRKNISMVIASADATWTTTRMASGLADAFRVNMSVDKSVHIVGSQIIVVLKVMNLSSEPRDLMLLMAKDEDKSDVRFEGGKTKEFDSLPTTQRQQKSSVMSATSSIGSSRVNDSPDTRNTVNTAVLYEVNGYVFGIWGLSGDDDGTVRYNRDHELLAVDAALLLGEVRGQHSLEAELRFVPLREGTLDVPNLKLYDRIQGKWYDCIHTLKIVAGARQ